MTGLARLTTGYAPPSLSEEWISTMGLARFLRFAVQGGRILGRLTAAYGEADAHYLASLAAAWNGCGFCGYGHALTGSLLWFRDHDRVHPLTVRQIERMMGLLDQESIVALESLLDAPPYRRLRRLSRRLFDLKMGHAAPEGAEDHLLMATVLLWTWSIECTITLGMTLDPEQAQPYMHRIYKDRRLRERYERARRAAETA
ncbi:MAG: hypothetical protein KDK70_05315 [Myxococcales bacterium]|nr:hypothetical protein [Myxococcales bacterium]